MVRQEVIEGKNLLKNPVALEIFNMFFKEWYTLREASEKYNPNLPKKERYNRRVTYFFYKFKKLGWIDEDIIKKIVPRKTAKGKNSTYPSKSKRYHLNYNFFFTDERNKSNLKEFLIYFLNRATVKAYLRDNYKNDVPSGVEEIIKQLFIIAISLKQSGSISKLRKDKDIILIPNINLENYQEKIKERMNKFYLNIINTKKKKISSKDASMLGTKKSFWVFLNMFAVTMIKLFFNKEFANEIVRASPELYFWLRNLHEDFSFIS